MTIPQKDQRILWARAAGICSNPTCRKDLTVDLASGNIVSLGEMAHIIAESPKGPRGSSNGGDNNYENLVLLCPTCHRLVDKAPDEHPSSKLRSWKTDHEERIRRKGVKRFADRGELLKFVRRKLIENRAIWRDLGPESHVASTDPGSNAHLLWETKKLTSIVPNNSAIISAVQENEDLLDDEDIDAFIKFKLHADGFEQNQYDRLDSYPLFPNEFEERFG